MWSREPHEPAESEPYPSIYSVSDAHARYSVGSRTSSAQATERPFATIEKERL